MTRAEAHDRKNCSPVVSTPPSCLEDISFKSSPTNHLFSLWFAVVFLYQMLR